MLVADGTLGFSNDVLIVLGSGCGVIALLFRLLISSKDDILKLALHEKDRLIEELTSERDHARKFCQDALQAALEQLNHARALEKKAPLLADPPAPETMNLPNSRKEREAAKFQSQLALLAKIKRESGHLPLAEQKTAAEAGPAIT